MGKTIEAIHKHLPNFDSVKNTVNGLVIGISLIEALTFGYLYNTDILNATVVVDGSAVVIDPVDKLILRPNISEIEHFQNICVNPAILQVNLPENF